MSDEQFLRPLSYTATLARFLGEHEKAGLAGVAYEAVALEEFEENMEESRKLLGLFTTYLQRHGIVFAMQSWVPSARSSTGRAGDF